MERAMFNKDKTQFVSRSYLLFAFARLDFVGNRSFLCNRQMDSQPALLRCLRLNLRSRDFKTWEAKFIKPPTLRI